MQIIAVSLNSVVITPLRFGKDLYVVFTRSCSFSFDKCLLSLRVLQATGGTHWLQDTKKAPRRMLGHIYYTGKDLHLA